MPIIIVWPKTTVNTPIVNMNVYSDVYVNFVLLHVFIKARRYAVCGCRYFLSYYKMNIRHKIDILSLVENIILNDNSIIVFDCSTALLIIGSHNEILTKYNILPRNAETVFIQKLKIKQYNYRYICEICIGGVCFFLMYPLAKTD